VKIVITVEVPDGSAVGVATSETTETLAKPVKVKAKAAPESAPPATPPAAPVATAPAAVLPPAAVEAPTPPTIQAVNGVVSKLAAMDRDVAIGILTRHGAAKVKTSTAQLKPEVYQVVIDETEEAIAKLDAAATQLANSGSLV
jgi:hypothetical protein